MIETPQYNRRQHPATEIEPPPPKPKKTLRPEWILGPLALLVMAYVLHHAHSVVTWDRVMDLLDVKNRERYTMLFHLGLAVTFVVAAYRILGRKKKE